MSEYIRRQDFVQAGQDGTPQSLAEKFFDVCSAINGDGSSLEMSRKKLMECAECSPEMTDLVVAKYGLTDEELDFIWSDAGLFVDKDHVTKEDLAAVSAQNAEQFDLCDTHIGNGDGHLSKPEMNACVRRGAELRAIETLKAALRKAQEGVHREIAPAPLPPWVSYAIYALIGLLALALVFKLLTR